MYTIYCHVFPNTKRYIGITKTDLNKRWGNGENYKTCPLVYCAICKYGWDNIQHEILDKVDTLDSAETLERFYISKFQTQNRKYGYNILPGGDVGNNHADEEMRRKLGNGWRGKHRSEEEKKKIGEGVKKTFSRADSNGHFGLKASKDTRRKMSESHKIWWNNNPDAKEMAKHRMMERMKDEAYKNKISENLSKYRRKAGEWHMSEDAKRKLSAANKGRMLGDKSPCSKPVLQYSIDGELIKRWVNASEVERAGIASRTNVAKCCRGVKSVKTVKGYVWKYE